MKNKKKMESNNNNENQKLLNHKRQLKNSLENFTIKNK